MEDQKPNSRVPSIAVTAGRPGNWKESPICTADMTIEELMAYFKRLNKKYKIHK
jgi:hypothetical protein